MPSRPPCATGSCAQSSSCRHSCVFAADASPAGGVASLAHLWSCWVSSLRLSKPACTGVETPQHNNCQVYGGLLCCSQQHMLKMLKTSILALTKAAPQSSVTAPQGTPPRSSASSSAQPHVHFCVRRLSKLRGCRRMLQAAPNPGSSCYVHHRVICTTFPSACLWLFGNHKLKASSSPTSTESITALSVFLPADPSRAS